MKRILVCEDEDVIREFVVINLKRVGYEVYDVNCGEEALRVFDAANGNFDIVLLDIMMPGIDGFQVCKELRKRSSTIGIIMLSAKTQEMDKVNGLMIGADDYITKPFSLSVLRARVNTQLRKAESLQAHTSASVYRKGCYEFDFERMIFLVDGQEIELSKTEQRLLRLLVQNEGINLRRDFLLDRVWNDSAEFVDANALSVSVKRLRDKLGIPDSIKTVYGIGYRFE